MNTLVIGDKVKIQERCNEGKQNKDIIFEVVNFPYNAGHYKEDYVSIENKETKTFFKAFLYTYLDKIN